MESFLTPYGLSNSGEEKLQFTPFWGDPKPGCSDGLRAGIIKSHNFFCLRSYPGEISHSNLPNQELSNDVWDLAVRRRKVALQTISHLTPIEAWRSAVPPLRRVVEFRARYRQIPVRGFSLGVGKIWRPCDLRSGSYKRLYTHEHKHTHTHTRRLI